MNTYPGATVVRGQGGEIVAGPYRGVLHSTEGDSAEGAIASFQSDGYWPHFTVSFEGGKFRVWQHLDLNESAAALEHRPGTCETNRQSAIQIECVGHAETASSWPAGYLTGLAGLMRWIESQTGIHPVSTVHWEGTDVGDSVRLSEAQWLSYNGWCGHAHVPNQEHWDPGKPDMAALLPKPVGVVVNGLHVTCPCFVDRGVAWVGARAIAATLGLTLTVDAHSATFSGHPTPVPLRDVGGTGYVAAHDLPAWAVYGSVHNLLQVTSRV